MDEISRNIAEEFFKKELFCAINGFEGMTFDEAIDKDAKFFITKDFIVSYVEKEIIIHELLLVTLSNRIRFSKIDKHFSKIGKNVFAEFKNEKLKEMIKRRYKNRIVEYGINNLILIFN